jgi:hypothetical protein
LRAWIGRNFWRTCWRVREQAKVLTRNERFAPLLWCMVVRLKQDQEAGWGVHSGL